MTGAKRLWCVLCVVVLCAGCAALRDDLRRAETAFSEARYEDTETWLKALERDLPDMDRSQRATFYFLRGTTAFRLENKGTALHYLALAREESNQDSTALRASWKSELETMLRELEHPALTPQPGKAGDAGGDDEIVPALSKTYK